MSKFRVILAAAFALLLSAASFAGPLDPDDPDGGGEIPGGGGPGSGGEVTPLIDPVAIIVPLAQQLAPLAAVAASLALLVYAVKQGAGMMLGQTGGDRPPGLVPKAGRGETMEEQLARAEGYLAAHRSAVRRARNQGYSAYASSGTLRRYGASRGGGDRSGSGSRSRSRSSSSRNGRRRR